ncbi:MAG: hypothetical protein K2M95_08200 [Clostridiales bacterium]|nr:hypothetical protein [Clostridiales bacterium]
MLNKSDLANALGLSCVEKYFLAWLGGRTDVTRLYGSAFVGIMQVLDDFAHGALYQNYCYLPRLQDVAEDYGIVEHEYRSCDKDEAKAIIRAQAKNELYLVRVNAEFFTGFRRTAWREDHYICIDENLQWVNEYPLSEGVFTEEAFDRGYGGAVLLYAEKDLAAKTDDHATSGLMHQDFTRKAIPHDSGALESAVGVLRVTRKRLEKFFCETAAVEWLLHEENVKLDKLYFNLRLAQTKGRAFSDTANEEIDALIQIEKQIAEVIKNEKKSGA